MKILIDNGHGIDTAGKRSPDGSLREYKYAREIAERIVSELKKQRFDAERIVIEETDISLRERFSMDERKRLGSMDECRTNKG